MTNEAVTTIDIYHRPAVDAILDEVADGRPLAKCLSSRGLDWKTWRKWQREDPGLHRDYLAAKEYLGQRLADECVEIADAPCRANDITGSLDMVDVMHRRLQIDTRKWSAAHLMPKVYSPKLQSLEAFLQVVDKKKIVSIPSATFGKIKTDE